MDYRKNLLVLAATFVLLFSACGAGVQSTPPSPTLPTTPAQPTATLVYLALVTKTGAAYYVSTSGNNANPGTLTQPWKTVQYAVDHASAGATIYLRGGTYPENVRITKSGKDGAPVILSGYPGETATIDGGASSALGGGANYWVIRDLTFTSAAFRTIYVEPVTHWQFLNNKIWGPLVLVGSYNLVQGNNVDGSLHKGDENGIMDGGADSHHNVYDANTVHNFDYRGIWSQTRTHDIEIVNNLVYDINGSVGACIDLDAAYNVTYRNKVIGNTVYNCGSIGIELENSFETLVENNLVYNTGIEGIVVINYLGCEAGGETNQYGALNGDCRGVMLNTTLRQNIIYNGGSTGGIVCYAAAGVTVVANTVYGGSSAGLYLNDDVNHCHDWHVYNNIFANNRRAEISVYNPASLTSDSYNLVYHPGINAAYQVFGIATNFYTLAGWKTYTGLGSHSVEANPLFVNAAIFDFHLLPGSPAINLGLDPGVLTDFDGNPRPKGGGYDLGVYEH
jgi:parallel beta-helix repeat protein